MREIKFKYIFSDGKEFKSTVLSLAAIENCQLKAFTNNIPSSFELVSVCQFTGLLYKNGVEIYEGDIVKQGDKIAEVVFATEDVGSCGCCYTEFNGSGFVAFDIYLSESEVIGNIYENEELLC